MNTAVTDNDGWCVLLQTLGCGKSKANSCEHDEHQASVEHLVNNTLGLVVDDCKLVKHKVDDKAKDESHKQGYKEAIGDFVQSTGTEGVSISNIDTIPAFLNQSESHE